MPIQAAANKLKNEIATYGNRRSSPKKASRTDESGLLMKEMAALGKKGSQRGQDRPEGSRYLVPVQALERWVYRERDCCVRGTLPVVRLFSSVW